MKLKSHRYWGAYEAQISLIFAKLLDNRGLLRANLLDFWALGIENLLDNSKSPGYSELSSVKFPDIWGL